MNKNFYIAIVVLIVIISVSFSLDFLLQKSRRETDFTEKNSLPLPVKSYKTSELYQELLIKCPDNSFSCFQDSSKDITKNYGPKASLEVLKMLQDNRLVDVTIDDHQYAHVVGRDAAHLFGVNPQAFLSCPTSFNYGCQHGYFEASLVMVKPAKKAIDLICGTLDDQYSTKFKFYCYHGVGHGIMDAQAYDLKLSLDLCDTLDNRDAQDGCWQGAFMENVNAGMRGQAQKDVFSKTDPLAPCNQVQDKYRHECYINHAGWLMKFFNSNIDLAISACLKAENYTGACLQSLGLMATNPVWQPALLKKENSSNDAVETGREICLKFPKKHRQECVVAGVDNILNFDELDTSRSQRFCNIIEKDLQKPCYARIGFALKNQATDDTLVIQKCREFIKEDFQKECLAGARLYE